MSQAKQRAEQILTSWSALYQARRELLQKYRYVWNIPFKNSHKQVLLEELRPNATVLEIGSSDRKLENLLTDAFEGLVYKSMDIDRQTLHDYYSLDEIGVTFDAVLLFEVIEHMPFDQGVKLLARIHDFLAPGGKLVMTTPNVAHPTHYYRDPTHVTPYSHEGLGGILVALGFEISRMYRIYNAPFVEKVFRKYVTSPICRYLGIDFAHSLLVVAARKVDDKNP
jgi:SAM-dependent methyltransferase